jgi:phage gpG-like protein
VRVDVQVDDAAVRAAISRAQRKTSGLSPLMREVAAIVENSTRGRFKTQADPDGKPWKPLSVSTKRARARRAAGGRTYTKNGRRTTAAFTRAYLSAQILLDTGRLRASIVSVFNAREAIVGSNLIYARIHQLGGQAGRGRRVTIPARPFLGLSNADRTDIVEAVQSFLAGALK